MLPEPFRLKIDSHRQILNSIRLYGELSGAELARLNNLQPSTLVYILRSLKDKDLIEISRIGSQLGSAGKPPTLWRLVKDKGYIIGLEIIPNEARATVIDFSCKIVHQEHKLNLNNIGPDNLITSTFAFTNELLQHLKLPKSKVIGVGIALTGLVDRERGRVHFSRKLELHNFPIEKELFKKLQITVEAVNDANAGALGIKWQANDKIPMQHSVVFLTLNEKIGYLGAGLILNQNLYEGAHGTAGEIFTSLPPLKKLVERGKEKYKGDHLIVNLMKQKKQISIDDVIECARENCRVSNYILLQFSQFIIDEILRIIEFLNPHLIVIGGDVTDAKDLISDFIIQKVNSKLQKIFPRGVPAPEIQFSNLGIYSVSYGATALIMRKIFL